MGWLPWLGSVSYFRRLNGPKGSDPLQQDQDKGRLLQFTPRQGSIEVSIVTDVIGVRGDDRLQEPQR